MQHTHFKFIGLEIPVLSFENIHKLFKQKIFDKDTALKIANNIKIRSSFNNENEAVIDCKQRLQIVFDCLNIIITQLSVNPTILKIILLPEFVFRPYMGAYTLEQAHMIVEEMRKFLGNPKWQDFKVVYSIFCAAECTNSNSDSDRAYYEAYNLCYMQKGNSVDYEATRFSMKKQLSTIDLIKRKKHAKFYEIQTPLLIKNTWYLEEIDLGSGIRHDQQFCRNDMSGAAVFKLDNITYAIEICVDHMVYRLKNNPLLNNYAQVQLIPGCGVVAIEDAIAVKPGGYAFYCDGLWRSSLYTRNLQGALTKILPRQTFILEHINSYILYPAPWGIRISYFDPQPIH